MDSKPNRKITNQNYRKFLDEGIINFINEEHINQALTNIKGKHIKEARSLLISLYYTGARPNEVLRIRAKEVTRDGAHICVLVPGSKNGLPRTIRLSYSKPLVKELYGYACSLFPDMFLFFNYKGNYIRKVLKRNGEIKERVEISNKLLYHFKRWFAGIIDNSIPTYYLRHNRFSKMSEKGATDQDLRHTKGCRSFESIAYYKHMSTDTSKKMAKMID